MDIYWKVVGLLLASLRPWSTPALQKMSLHPCDRKENPLMLQFFTWESRGDDQCSWWKHFEQEVPHLRNLGVTHVWLPPPNKAMSKQGAGYDAYDLWDLGEFDQKGTIATRWGTKEEFVRACSVAKANGIEIIIDAVLGHKLGGDRKETFNAVPVRPDNRLIHDGPAREIEAWTGYDFPGRKDKYSSMKWNHEHFTGVDYDSKTRSNNIHYIISPRRTGWSRFVDNEFGNYDYLLGCDIDHTHPDVREDLFNWGSWILETSGATGFRLDAIKHMDRRFLVEFLERVKKNMKQKALFAVSEYWSGDIERLEAYTKFFRGHSAFFDVPLHYRLHEASKQGSKFDLRTIFQRTLVERRPWDAVTFVDNHDTQKGQTLESWVESGFKLQAYTLTLLRGNGFPCVFYGDLYPNKECYDAQIAKKLERLVLARKRFAYGQTVDYFQHPNCIGFVRTGDEQHPGCAVMLRTSDVAPESHDSSRTADATSSEREALYARLNIKMRAVVLRQKSGRPTSAIQCEYRDFLEDGPDAQKVRVDSDGWATFPCPASGVAVWVADDVYLDRTV